MTDEEVKRWRQVFDDMSYPMHCTYFVNGETYQAVNRMMGWESFVMAMSMLRAANQQSVGG